MKEQHLSEYLKSSKYFLESLYQAENQWNLKSSRFIE